LGEYQRSGRPNQRKSQDLLLELNQVCRVVDEPTTVLVMRRM
jgi:hypothetical protein